MSQVRRKDIEINLEGVVFRLSESKVMLSRVKRRGSSLYVLIPKYVAEDLELNEGDYVIALIHKIKNVELKVLEEVEKYREEVMEGGE